MKEFKINAKTEIAIGEIFGVLNRAHEILAEAEYSAKGKCFNEVQKQITVVRTMLDQVETTITETIEKQN